MDDSDDHDSSYESGADDADCDASFPSIGNEARYLDEKAAEEEQKRKNAELENAPLQAELKHLERRWTRNGKQYITEIKDEHLPGDNKADWHEKFALCVLRTYNHSNSGIVSTHLQVNSEHLKKTLREIIGSYPGQSFATKAVAIQYPPECLYHYRHELEEAGKSVQACPEAMEHHAILTQYIDEYFQEVITEVANLQDQGLVSFDLLWTHFRPGDYIYASQLGQPRVYRLVKYRTDHSGLVLTLNYVDFDGEDFGIKTEILVVGEFEGTTVINQLGAFPLRLHQNEQGIRELLIGRGRIFESLAGPNFREYSGIARDFVDFHGRFNIQGRVMVDCKTAHRINPNAAFRVTYLEQSWKRKATSSTEKGLPGKVPHRFVKLSEESCLLAPSAVRGFSFTEKKFLEFLVDGLSPVEFNETCFDQLVLPHAHKETVQALVSEHTNAATQGTFDDIVKGKGRGLVLVLHGPLGVGKTLTAECVAEFAHCPLYMVSSGDLGNTARDLNATLSRILDLASTWKAVLLIDEADVFLERRSLHDMQRNSLVSVFLRTLEYYSGILFMTTNRVRTFDDAFKSRIHVPLKYEELPQSSRKTIWRNFLSKIDGGVEIEEESLDKLSEANLNGRTIKNVIRTAKSLAAYKKQKLDMTQLNQVVDIQAAFEKDLETSTPSSGFDIVER